MDYIPLTAQGLAALLLGVLFTAAPGLAAAAFFHHHDRNEADLEIAVIEELTNK